MIFPLRPSGQATMLTNARITKPAYAVGIVDRARLYRRLDGWRMVRAVAIHAPAGYGKSSLVSRWLDECTPDGPRRRAEPQVDAVRGLRRRW